MSVAANAVSLPDFVARDMQDRVFRNMVETLPVAAYTTDAEGRLTWFNTAAVRLSGRVPELGTDKWCVTWKIFLPDGSLLPHDQCPMAAALRGEEVPNGIEFMAERPDGTRFWFSPCPAAVRDGEGRIIGGINLLTDITERKTVEVEAVGPFRAIVETTPECVKIVARDGTLLFMNQPGLAMVGARTPEEVIGYSVYALIAPEHRARFQEMNERVCRGQKATFEFDIVGLQGSRRQMETHAAPLRQADGVTVQLALTRDITQRKRAERAAQLLGAIVDSSDDAIVSKNLDGIITSWNGSADRLFGYTAAEAVGRSVTMLIPDDRPEEEPNILARLRRGERVDHFETIRRRKDGTLFDISLTISPVKDAAGVIIGASKIGRDISERKRAERAIQTLNHQLTVDLAAMTRMQRLSTRMVEAGDFRELLRETLSSAIEITGADMGHIQLLEDGVLQMTTHHGLDKSFLDFFGNVAAGEAVCGAALQQGRRVVVEDVASSPIFAGQPALAVMLGTGIRAVHSTPLVSRGGQVLGVLSTHFRWPHRPAERDLRLMDILARQTADLIERKKAEAALMASEARFRQLADTMPQMVWTARPDGYVDYYNERWYAFTGVAREVFGDASWAPYMHPDDLPEAREAYYAAIESGEPYSRECRYRDRENRTHWFVCRGLPVRDARGRVVKWFGTCTDIDEQKRVEQDLRRANHDLEQFAFSASHDLQEPLRGIKIYSELLTTRCAEQLDGDARTFVRYLREGATRMETLVRDLLAYTQTTTLDGQPQISDAGKAFQMARSSLAGIIAETGAHVISGPLPSLPVHITHLQQLFQNLVGNAVKYRSPERIPEVHVTAERQNGWWTFAVADNGIGIDPAYKESIFGLFKRLHTSEEYSGTGIGLAICQRIVDRYNGRIWVESEPGHGSVFRFTLPG
jgi:PAS domain S-box-containing protein